MNRAQRRASAFKKAPAPAPRLRELLVDDEDAAILEEALAGYIAQLDEWGNADRGVRARAARMRSALDKATTPTLRRSA